MKRTYIDFRNRKKTHGISIKQWINLIEKSRKKVHQDEWITSTIYIRPGKYKEDLNICD